MTVTTQIQTNQWLDRARALAPLIEQHRDQAERERQMPRPLFEAERDAGLLSLWLPRRLGGPEVDIETLVLVVEEISRQDGSAGWNTMIGSESSGLAGFLPEEGAKEVFNNLTAVVAGSFQPRGQATVVEDGYRVSGRWPMASGCNNAGWLVGGCLVKDDGQIRLGPDGQPETSLFFFPAPEGRIIDTWQTGGMRGTGSHDIEASDVFVPEQRRLSLIHARGPEALYGFSIPVLFVLPIAAVALGIARDAVETFRQMAGGKTPTRSQTVLAERGSVHAAVGRAEVSLRAARSLVLDVAAEMQAIAASGRELTPKETSMVGAAGAFAAETASDAVTAMFRLAGSTSLYSSNRLERCIRDVNMVTQHVTVNTFNFDNAGRQSLLSAQTAP